MSLEDIAAKVMKYDEAVREAESAPRRTTKSVKQRAAESRKALAADPRFEQRRARDAELKKLAEKGREMERLESRAEHVGKVLEALSNEDGWEEVDGVEVDPETGEQYDTVNSQHVEGTRAMLALIKSGHLDQEVYDFLQEQIDPDWVDEQLQIHAYREAQGDLRSQEAHHEKAIEGLESTLQAHQEHLAEMIRLNPHLDEAVVSQAVRDVFAQKLEEPAGLGGITVEWGKEAIDHAFYATDFARERELEAKQATDEQARHADAAGITEDSKDSAGNLVTRSQKMPDGSFRDLPIRTPYEPEWSPEAWDAYLTEIDKQKEIEAVVADVNADLAVEQAGEDTETDAEYRAKQEAAAEADRSRRERNLRMTGAFSGNPSDPSYDPNGPTAQAAREAFVSEHGQDALDAEMAEGSGE